MGIYVTFKVLYAYIDIGNNKNKNNFKFFSKRLVFMEEANYICITNLKLEKK
jgi:hypothetical protein